MSDIRTMKVREFCDRLKHEGTTLLQGCVCIVISIADVVSRGCRLMGMDEDTDIYLIQQDTCPRLDEVLPTHNAFVFRVVQLPAGVVLIDVSLDDDLHVMAQIFLEILVQSSSAPNSTLMMASIPHHQLAGCFANQPMNILVEKAEAGIRVQCMPSVAS